MVDRKTALEEEDVSEEGGGEEGFDLKKLKTLIGFFLRSANRHRTRVLAVATIPFLLAVCLAFALPKTYTVDMRVLAQRNVVIPSVEDPGHTSAPMEDPTKGVVDQVMKRDNVIALIKQLDLVSKWDSTRPPVLRGKDTVIGLLHGPPSDDDKIRALVGIIEQRLSVGTDQDSISFTADWPNAEMAYALVTTAYKNFIDARYETEVNVFAERLKILEMRSQLIANNVDQAIADMTKLELAKKRGAAPPEPAEPKGEAGTGPREVAPASARDAAAAAAASRAASAFDTARQLETIRTQVRTLEDERHRRATEAEGQLADAQASLGPLNPTVLALKQKVEALNVPSPQLESLRSQERALVEDLAASAPRSSDPAVPVRVGGGGGGGGGRNNLGLAPLLSPDIRDMLERDDPATAYARSKLQSASAEYSDMLSRTQLAKVELDVARESFKETYSIARPAEVPRKPRKPNVPVILLGGLVFGLLVGFVIPGLRDLASGRFIEPWQVESNLNLPLLGELTAPDEFDGMRDRN
jgi:uncharacterized protein involved in exopolysaccharide biosynthesis